MRSFLNIFFLVALFSTGSLTAQIPPGYYTPVVGKTGDALKDGLYDIIKNHLERSYASLWTHFQKTDINFSGDVWDIYTDIPSGIPVYTFAFVSNQCGSYTNEGDCYNREHSVPSSWFSGGTPMESDLFHVYPTDGKVNQERGNHPYGEVGSASYTSSNGSMVGTSSYPGYSGTVFEPIDAYKGDLARTYFYMMTRYKTVVGSWTSDMLSGNDLSAWAEAMLLDWHTADPVSQKEIDRNDSIWTIQNNRNPFIDHPEWVSMIWGATASVLEAGKNAIKIWSAGTTLILDANTPMRGTLEVMDIKGGLVLTKPVEGTHNEFGIEIPPGIYIARFVHEVGVISQRLVLQ